MCPVASWTSFATWSTTKYCLHLRSRTLAIDSIMSGNIKSTLEQATKGLLYMSESDEPFEVIEWLAEGALNSDEVLRLSGNKPSTPISEQRLAQFFDDAIAQQED